MADTCYSGDEQFYTTGALYDGIQANKILKQYGNPAETSEQLNDEQIQAAQNFFDRASLALGMALSLREYKRAVAEKPRVHLDITGGFKGPRDPG